VKVTVPPGFTLAGRGDDNCDALGGDGLTFRGRDRRYRYIIDGVAGYFQRGGDAAKRGGRRY